VDTLLLLVVQVFALFNQVAVKLFRAVIGKECFDPIFHSHVTGVPQNRFAKFPGLGRYRAVLSSCHNSEKVASPDGGCQARQTAG
jgi:hypothetical protein